MLSNRSNGISSATFYKWRDKYGDMDVSVLSQVKQLDVENNRLKKIYAELQLDQHVFALPSRIVVGLLLLKQMSNLSNEEVCAKSI